MFRILILFLITVNCVLTTVKAAPLNDTGITRFGDGENNDLSTEPPGYPGQDASAGRDAAAAAGTLNKSGGGNAGFDFTKLDGNGNPLPASATAWQCVRDNVTGLIWEVKTDDGGLHDKDDEYNWYNPDPATNGGSAGYEDDDGAICYGYQAGNPATYCNTRAFVARVNARGLCGAHDWRLPTVDELLSIVDNSRYGPAIDTGYFPNTPSSGFWSSSPFANYSFNAWFVLFSHGYVYSSNKDGAWGVRLVRGGQ